jgi:plastocyanin
MKRIVLLIVVAAAVAVVPGSTAATVQVAITARGFVPNAITIGVGDTVTWTNSDTRNRKVVSTDAGFTSTVLTPTQTFSFTFTKVGKFRYEDPSVNPKQRGTVTVRRGTANSVTIAAQPKTVTFGRSTVLSGKTSLARAGEKVTISAKRCRSNAFAKVGDAMTAADGSWSLSTKPLDHTTYRAQWGGATSDAAVRARPRISLGKLSAHKYRVRVFAAESFAGKSVTFQRYNATRRVWVGVKSVTLVDTGLGVDPTVISGKDFRSKISAGKRVRINMGQTAAGSCYLANRSGVIRS